MAACGGTPPDPEPPPPPDARWAQAESNFLAERYAEALATLESMEADGRADARLHDLAGRCCMGLKRPDAAADYFSAAVERAADPIEATASRGRLVRALVTGGAYPAARIHARRVLESPHADRAVSMAPFLFLAGTAAARADAWSEAREHYLRAVDVGDADLRRQARSRLAVVELRHFTVQHGVFRSADGARRAAERHGGKVLTAGELHIVVSGRYDDWDAARKAAARADAIAVP